MAKTIRVKFEFREDSVAAWAYKNPVLDSGEPGYEKLTGRFKVGNGLSTWNQLDYFITTHIPAEPLYYLHEELTPNGSWTIQHNLGVLPNISILIDDEVIAVPVLHSDINTAIVSFSTPQSGKAICS